MSLNVSKKLFVGKGADYTELKSDGEMILHGGARVVDHLNLDPKRFKLPGASYPGESFEGIYHTLDFDKNTEQNAYVIGHIPFWRQVNTDIEVVVHWFHDTNQVDNTKKVLWGLEYKSMADGELVAGSGTEITQLTAGNHDVDAGLCLHTEFITANILGSDLSEDDHIAIRFFRKAADGTDTLDEDARFIQLHLNIIRNRISVPV